MGFNFKDDKDLREIAASLDRAPGGDQLVELDRLDRRYGNGGKRPWLDRFGDMVPLAKAGSYVCNIASALGLFYVVKIIFEVVPYPIVGVLAGLVSLVLFEHFKRKASDGFWDHFWITRRLHWPKLALNLGLFALSLLGTLYGVYYMIQDNSPEARVMGTSNDPEAVAMMASVADLDAQIDALNAESKRVRESRSSYNAQGEFLWPLLRQEEQRQKQITSLQGQKTSLQDQLASRHGIIEVHNTEILSAWQMRNDTRIISALSLCLLLEVLFEVCMSFLSVFHFKRYTLLRELEKRGQLNRPKTTPAKRRSKPALNGHPIPA